MPNYFQYKGTNFVHVSDFDALSAERDRLARKLAEAEVNINERNKREWDLMDDITLLRGRANALARWLAEAEALLRWARINLPNDGMRKRIDAYFAPDSASVCRHLSALPWKLQDGRDGWKCDDCGAEFRLTADQPSSSASPSIK